jgi:hypothetical protein
MSEHEPEPVDQDLLLKLAKRFGALMEIWETCRQLGMMPEALIAQGLLLQLAAFVGGFAVSGSEAFELARIALGEFELVDDDEEEKADACGEQSHVH